ncbi:MAG: DnaJ domain-containing protein [Deltaproteobacteria bacterium]|nr:DnaJ domain-containing protein [Deltaproteobacteria bacterium]
MSLPSAVFLRHAQGVPIGPLPLWWLEVLFDSRVVDGTTPVSLDGQRFTRLEEWPEILGRLETVKAALTRGEDPWSEPEPTPSTPEAMVLAAERTVIGRMVRLSAQSATGTMTLGGVDGVITLDFKDGRVVSVSTDIERLSLAGFLLFDELVDQAALDEAAAKAPSMGGDLGGALIALGKVQPHVYFEKYLAWAKKVLGAAVAEPFEVSFEAGDVATPAVPLGFDRLGAAMDAVRSGLNRSRLQDILLPKRACPLIISQVEGVQLEDVKLKPRELRALKAVDGVKALGDLLDDLGGSDEKVLPVLQAVYFGEQAGFVVFGEDPLIRKELAEAQTTEAEYQRLLRKDYFEVLGISQTSSDDEVRSRYTDLAKRYHPDKIRKEAAPELLEARRKVFALVSEAADHLETEDARYKYAHDLETGAVGGQEALEKAQAILQSETLFKKAEILLRVRKYDEALQHINQAIALNPDDTEFKILREYLGYLSAARRGEALLAAESAARAILALMKNDANIASGYLYLGHLQNAQGKEDLAFKYFEKVLEYDEHHPEALSQVRVGRLRKEKKKKKRFGF